MKLFPAIDLLHGNCVRLFQGDYAQETVYEATPADQASVWERAGAPLIHLVDLDGAKTGAVTNSDAIRSICARVSIPCELGGGIRTVDDAKRAFDLGVSRVILGTAVCDNPNSAEDFINAFGPEKIVAGIDARGGKVATRGWIETSEVEASALARTLFLFGVERFIFTDIATDGALKGPNLPFMRSLCEQLPDCKIIASGGVSSPADVKALASLGRPNLEGVIIGKALYDGRASYAELLAAAGDPA